MLVEADIFGVVHGKTATAIDHNNDKLKIQPWQLSQRQGMPLWMKIKYSEKRIISWYEQWDGNVYVAFSGGKDSTVLLSQVRSLYPNVPAVFVDTGLEYPEIRNFVKNTPNVTWLKPSLGFRDVVEKYGYPVISKKTSTQIRNLQNATPLNCNTRHLYLTGQKKDGTISKCYKLPEKYKYLADAPFKISEKCCNILKKSPLQEYSQKEKRRGFVGTMASDSRLRTLSYLSTGCNSLSSRVSVSTPMAFWQEHDVWEYIKQHNIQYSSIYENGYKSTGCMFCMFGVHLEKSPNRFQKMAKTHPAQYRYCMETLNLATVLHYLGVPYKQQVSEIEQQGVLNGI